MENLRWQTVGRSWGGTVPGPGLEDGERRGRVRAEQVRGEVEERGGGERRGGERRVLQAEEQD